MVEFINDTLVVEGNLCGGSRVCCKKDKNLKTMVPPCGLRNVMGLGRYGMNLGKSESEEKFAELAEFPWVVSIEYNEGKICSGSLINEKVVMTSANCVSGKKTDSMRVRAGSWKNSVSVGLQTDQLRDVARIIYHDENVNHFQPNIALLVLENPVEMNMFVGTACLSQSTETLVMDECLAVGWESGQPASNELMFETKIKLLPCEGFFGKNVIIPEKSKCAVIKKQFEMGSAVMCRINNTESNYQQIGIVQHNPRRATHVILIDVNEFKNEIDKKFAALEIDDDSYTFSYLSSRGFFSFFKSMKTFFDRYTEDSEYREQLHGHVSSTISKAYKFVNVFSNLFSKDEGQRMTKNEANKSDDY